MTKLTGDPEMVSTRPTHRLWARPLRSPMVGGFLAIVCLIVLFYAEENWRGKRAWGQCQRELAAQGAVMERTVPVPTSIPDNLNVFKAPGMSGWFLAQAPNDLAARLNRAWSSMNPRTSADLIEIIVVSRTNQPASLDSDLCLDYDPPLLTLADPARTETVREDPPQLIPLIVMDAVPLSDAIKNLARQAGRDYLLDSNLVWEWTQTGPTLAREPVRWLLDRFAGSPSVQEPCVSLRWQNVTPFQALMALLDRWNLIWIEDATNHTGRIAIKSKASSLVQVTPAARDQLKQVLARVSSPPGPETQTLNTSQGFVLYHQDNPSAGLHTHLARITVRSAIIPGVNEVESFFPHGSLPWLPAWSALRALPSGINTFRVFANPTSFCAVEDYLAQTDPCKPEFDLMREALRRPYARGDENYGRPATAPPRNFVQFRVVSQALAQRAQSYLLLGQPERALEELTLIHDLSAVLEAESFSLVAALIEGAITGLYVTVIHDGLRLGAWREPQLLALQGQLEKIHLGPLMVAGLSSERLAIGRTIESASASEFANSFNPGHEPQNLWEKLKSPGFCVLTFAPRGWRYQSMAASASLLQGSIACFDRATQTLRSCEIERAESDTERARTLASPTTLLAEIATPMCSRAWQTMVRNQSFVDQAFIACALERYRLARDEYPPGLGSLAPKFADQVPHETIGGGKFHYRRLDSTHFTLYSVGWNGHDQGGLAPESDSVANYTKADWVWN